MLKRRALYGNYDNNVVYDCYFYCSLGGEPTPAVAPPVRPETPEQTAPAPLSETVVDPNLEKKVQKNEDDIQQVILIIFHIRED